MTYPLLKVILVVGSQDRPKNNTPNSSQEGLGVCWRNLFLSELIFSGLSQQPFLKDQYWQFERAFFGLITTLFHEIF